MWREMGLDFEEQILSFRVAPNVEGDGLDYLMRMYILSPLEQNK